jgi:hypothetical protein
MVLHRPSEPAALIVHVDSRPKITFPVIDVPGVGNWRGQSGLTSEWWMAHELARRDSKQWLLSVDGRRCR